MNILTTNDRVGVVILDPDEISRSGCKTLFEEDERFEVVGHAPHIEAFLAHNSASSFDVVVANPVIDGKADVLQVQQIRTASPDAHIMLLTEPADVAFYVDALRAGTSALFLKGQTPGWLLLNIAQLIGRSSATVIDGAIQLHMKLAGAAWEAADNALLLSRRETEVASLLSEGLSDDEVANTLGIARATVHTHVSSIMRKVPATNRVQLGIYLVGAGLLSRDCAKQSA